MTVSCRISANVALVSVLLFLLGDALAMQPCPSFCRFRLCHNLVRKGNELQKENRGYLLDFPDTEFGSFPCIQGKGGFIRQLRNITAGEARISERFANEFTPISKFASTDVKPAFRKRFFRFVQDRLGSSVISRTKLRGNQGEIIDKKCVQIPIKSYVTMKGRRRRPPGKRACVGFRAVVPVLLIEFQWTSPDDLDITLEEPGGARINRFGANNISPNGGKFIVDTGSEVCGGRFGRERVAYTRKATVEKGTYTLTVDRSRNCVPTTPYRIRVMFNTEIIVDERGVITDPDATSNIASISFTI